MEVQSYGGKEGIKGMLKAGPPSQDMRLMLGEGLWI
jgi:hypothetical protein